MNFKFGVKQIVLTIVTFVLLAVLIAGNIVLDINKLLLHKLFTSNNYASEAGGEAYEMGDAMVSQLVEDSVVLFRNENNTLPLDATNAKEKKVNLFGWNSTTDGFLLTGTGSGGSPVLDQNRVTLAEAFVEAGYEYNETLYADYESNSGANGDKINKYGQFAADSQQAIHNPGASFYTSERMQQARDYSDVAIIVLSRNTGENCGSGKETLNFTNYTNGTWLELTENEKIMLDNVTKTFADGKVIVLLNTTNTMELGFLETYNVDAALYIGAPGQSGARAIPYLLYGEKEVDGETVQISPSGRTSDTYAYNYNLVDGKNYSASWTSALNTTGPNSLYYQEGIYIGYKWYETADAEGFFDAVTTEYGSGYDGIVQYPFGYGLSYTTFKWTVEEWPSSKELTADGKYEIQVRVQNTGNHPGKDVVELYYTPPYINGGIEKSSSNLLAFAKTVTLQPGDTQLLTLSFTAYDLASYDDYDKNGNNFYGYELDSGDHVVTLMTDAHHEAICYDILNNEREADNSFKFNCSGVLFATDPVTGTEVSNLFTNTDSSEAWDGTPIDGSTAFNTPIEYLSRENGFANFPDETTFTCKAPNNQPSQTYATDAWDSSDISGFKYGQDANMYIVTKEDGSKATQSELGSSDSNLKYNVELMEKLWDYDAEEWDTFLNQLSQDDIRELIRKGQFQTVALESVGKPFCNEYDGPAGFNRNSVAGAVSDPKWVVFPVEILLGCSWNTQTTYNMGKAMGVIGNETGIHGWYGPGLNLHRSPYYGRNFEYYSEDAVLTGKLVAECIRGAKENNLTCYMKHYVAADIGNNSGNWYTWLTEQNLRENYLRPFEIAVKEGGANAVMSGFSAVGATWAGSNYALSIQILRNEWGFRGSMITDWYNGYMDLIRGIKGGNDLWLGSNSSSINFSDNAQAYCARQSAKNILYTYIDCYMTAKTYTDKVASGEFDDPYTVNVDKPLVANASYSPLFVALWAIVDILIIAGMAVCVLFIVLPFFKKNNKTVPETATVSADNGNSGSVEETPAQEVSEDKPEE